MSEEALKFGDKVYLYCLKIEAGTNIRIADIPNLPDKNKFIESVKESMSWGLLKDFHFSNDFEILYREPEWKPARKIKMYK